MGRKGYGYYMKRETLDGLMCRGVRRQIELNN